MEAIASGDTTALRHALAGGADANARHGFGLPLVEAARGGRIDLIQMLLTAGADPWLPDGHGNLPVAVAGQAGHTDAAMALGNAMRTDAEAGGWSLWLEQMLTVAARVHPAWARGLMAAGARPGAAALAAAIEHRDIDLIHAFLEEGAPVAEPHDGTPPLVRAVLAGQTDIVAVLLAAGADVHQRDAAGRTPLSLVLDGHVPDEGSPDTFARILHLLREHDA